MIDHKVLNLFNKLFISSVRIEVAEGWCCIHFKNLIRTHVQPVLLGLFTSFVGLSIVVRNWQYFMQHVLSLSSILRYSAITFVNIVANIFFFVWRKKFAILVEKLLRFDQYYSIMTNTCTIMTEAKFTRTQFMFAFISYLTVMLTNIAMVIWYEFGPYTKILLICCIFIEFHFSLQQLYAVFFAEHLSIRYRLIRDMVQNDAGQKLLLEVMKLYDQLEAMQKLISEAFGLYCVLCSLTVFLSTAITVYSGIIMLDKGDSVFVVLVEAGNIIPTLVLFYGMIYTFDLLILEVRKFFCQPIAVKDQ